MYFLFLCHLRGEFINKDVEPLIYIHFLYIYYRQSSLRSRYTFIGRLNEFICLQNFGKVKLCL